MKRIKLFAGIAILGLLTLRDAAALPPLPTGPVNFKLSALAQLDDSVTLKTNKTTTSTNITTTTKSAVNTKSVVNKDILKLLANSFTNLPTTITNGQLVTDGEGSFFVVTSTSTNDVTSVLKIEFDDWVFSGSEAVVMKSPPGTTTSETETATATQAARLTYDDSELTTRDGKHTTFTLHGLMVTKYGDATTKFTTSFTLTGQGDGSAEDKFVVFSGTLTGSISGNVDLDDF
jgi:hypothetical protein